MSETMAASERAKALINLHGVAWFQRGLYTAKKHVAETADADAALLAYVADLEAVAEAVRAAWDLDRHPRLMATLAALDRPEDEE